METELFLERLAASNPTPGGGSASALAGALAASLVSMVAGLSLKKGGIEQKRMREIRKRAGTIRKKLFRAIEEDARSFDAVMKAFRLPKGLEKERLRRKGQIQKAYQKATLAPQRVCQEAIRLLDYSRVLILKGNPNALGDAGVAAFLSDAAVAGGLLNIRLNLTAVTEKKFLRKMRSLIKRWTAKRNHLMGDILKILKRQEDVHF